MKVSVTRGVRVVVAAELAGYQPTSQTLEISTVEPSMAIALDALAAIASDAGVADAAPAAKPDARTPSKPPRKRPPAGSNADTFNPNEVGGD
ncbi:MAG: hypothetical protein H0T42_14040 [Deltaproteobacteria bacterium]|nr:hypothetical protein [Deltaproteobacteria bacterium]